MEYTGHTQKNGAVSIDLEIETAPFFCVCPVLCIEKLITKLKNEQNSLSIGRYPYLSLINPLHVSAQLGHYQAV